jgi:hypothetical protein
VVGLAAFVWVGANIPLGSRTLFEHLQAIGRTRETRDLLDGTKQAGKPFVDSVRDSVRDGVRRRLGGSNAEVDDQGTASERASIAPDGGVPPADHVSETDREQLRKVLGAEATTRTPAKGATKGPTKAPAQATTKAANAPAAKPQTAKPQAAKPTKIQTQTAARQDGSARTSAN